MTLLLLIIVPALGGCVALALRDLRVALWLLVGMSVAHFLATTALWWWPAAPLGAFLDLDVPGHLFLSITSATFVLTSIYALPYVLRAARDPDAAPARFVPCLLWFLAAMSVTCTSQHLGTLWAGIEATSLASAPLIYFYRRRAALEAMWKYLLICSVGIALALLGTFFLGIAASARAGVDPRLFLGSLRAAAPFMARPWLQAAFVLALVGYGTKMGLAPMHTWLPDAYGQAPAPVAALMSATLPNCALLGVLRFYQVCLASGDSDFARTMLLGFGVVSVAVAVAFMVGQRDYQRLLAYSCVENMGVVAFALGLGNGTQAAFLQAINNSLGKAALFFAAGSVTRAYGTTDAAQVRGVFARLPLSGTLLAVGFLAVGGSPPFAPFMSEFSIFQAALRGPHAVLGVVLVAFLAIGFIGMAATLLPMLQGNAEDAPLREPAGFVAPPLVLCAGLLVLGVYLPPALAQVLHQAAELFSAIAARNPALVALDAVPSLAPEEFRDGCVAAVRGGARLAAFVVPAPGEVIAVLAHDADGQLRFVRTRGHVLPSLTAEIAQAQAFERELWESHGFVVDGHPWLKPLRAHPEISGSGPPHRFFRVAGGDVHEVAVGPIHAGVIEPGHFRFQCQGETVLSLEIHLGYQQRGALELLRTASPARRLVVAESIAGDTAVGHALAHCLVVEALGGARLSLRAEMLRGIALELERIAAHVGDLGALCNDVAFLPGASFFGRLRGEFLNLLAELCGNRFGRGLVVPGGVRFDLDASMKAAFLARLGAAEKDLRAAADLMFEQPSVLSRFEHTGVVTRALAVELGLVGTTARASGVERDVRRDHPCGIYQFAFIPIAVAPPPGGDVLARALVRWIEVQRSIRFVREQLVELPEGALSGAVGAARPEQLAVALVEGWRGEIVHAVVTDAAGGFAAVQVVDPSFHNWMALAMALRGDQISDFPLCNKSFNLSYAGHDL